MDPDRRRVTQLLNDVRQGDREHEAELFSLIYQELRRLAQHHMRNERPSHTLQATALVNEAYLRIFGRDNTDWRSRSHFLAIASREFRRTLIEHARHSKADKRGGDAPRISLDALATDVAGTAPDVDALALNLLLEELTTLDPEAGRVVELKFFSGLTDEEIAEELQISFAKVRRHWTFARSWFLTRLQRGSAAASAS